MSTNAQHPLQLTRDLLHFNTINPPGMERDCARHLGKLLESAGFEVKYHEFAEARTSVVATIGGVVLLGMRFLLLGVADQAGTRK